MKKTLSIISLTLVFSFAAFSQANENPCPSIKIKSPETVQPEEKFKVFASFDNEAQPSTSKFHWTIIKNDKVSKIKERGIIEIDTRDLEEGGTIVLLAESINENCQNTAITKIFVVSTCILPFKIDEYSKLDWNEEKARLANVVAQMRDFEDLELFIDFKFDKKTQLAKNKEYLLKVLNFLSETRGFKEDRITFFISEFDIESVSFLPLSEKLTESYGCYDCIVIRGEDLEKIASIFGK